MMGRTLCLF